MARDFFSIRSEAQAGQTVSGLLMNDSPIMINLFVTDRLGYDIDRDRTGGCSIRAAPGGVGRPVR